MVNVDLLISVGIWVAGVGMSAVGVEMTIHPPNQVSKWWYRGAFILMGIGFVGLGVWQFDRADQESKRLAAEHQEEQVRSEGNIKYMQGQVDAVLVQPEMERGRFPLVSDPPFRARSL